MDNHRRAVHLGQTCPVRPSALLWCGSWIIVINLSTMAGSDSSRATAWRSKVGPLAGVTATLRLWCLDENDTVLAQRIGLAISKDEPNVRPGIWLFCPEQNPF